MTTAANGILYTIKSKYQLIIGKQRQEVREKYRIIFAHIPEGQTLMK